MVNNAKLRKLLEDVAEGVVSPDSAADSLKNMPFEDLGFAKLDHHRQLRKGMPETIFASGKTPEQVITIIEHMRQHGSNVLATRCDADMAAEVIAAHGDVTYHEVARCLTLTMDAPEQLEGYIAIVCAGTSDLSVAEEAAVTCESIGNRVERIADIGVAGLHRLLDQRECLGGANAIVVCAGMEGALPTAVAGLVDRPIIAVPTSVGYGASFGGIAALLGMLNSCAEGVSVVNIDNGFGAGVNASLINRLANGKVL
ncbi:MAG: nickel pincer cofactor biosynthesis protein LarB [Candidatus Hydrogenedentota bacterium]